MRYEPVCRAIVVVLVLSVVPGVVEAQESEAARGLTRLPIADAEGDDVGLLYTGSFALVIGVSDYEHWSDLPGVKRDVLRVHEALEAHGFHVTVVQDPDARQLRQAFSDFIYTHDQEPDRRILIYFAGHGHSMARSFGGKMGYVVPRDAPDPRRDTAGFKSAALNMNRIQGYGQEIESKHALLLFDSCFSGSIFTLTRAIPSEITAKTAEPVWQFITAGTEDEKVPGESIFLAQFVAVLEGEGDLDGDGYATGSELGQFLQQNAQEYSSETQNPQYGTLADPRLNKGDFVFPLPRGLEQERWDDVKEATRPADFRAFLEAFPAGRFAGDARQKLSQLEQTRWDEIKDSTARALAADGDTKALSLLDAAPKGVDLVEDKPKHMAVYRFRISDE